LQHISAKSSLEEIDTRKSSFSLLFQQSTAGRSGGLFLFRTLVEMKPDFVYLLKGDSN
jgi:hypothetical protein